MSERALGEPLRWTGHSRLRLRLEWLLALALVAGCGRRATEADCQLIVDKSVELQMKQMSENDPRTVAQREQEVRSALEGDIQSCQSRRVTDRTMGCVRSATSTKELDSCLR